MSLQQLPGLSRNDSYSIQTQELKKYEEQRLLNQSKEIIKNYNNYFQDESLGAELNRAFVDPKSGQKTVREYKETLKRANKAKITLDIDGAIVNALASVARAREMLLIMRLSPSFYGKSAIKSNTESVERLKENIDFLLKIPKSKRRNIFKNRVENFHIALFKLIISNTLTNEGYNLIRAYASRQGIDIQVEEMRRALVNTEIRTPVEFRNIVDNVQNGGMWQSGGFFMTCC